ATQLAAAAGDRLRAGGDGGGVPIRGLRRAPRRLSGGRRGGLSVLQLRGRDADGRRSTAPLTGEDGGDFGMQRPRAVEQARPPRVDEDGITFASHLDGAPQRLTPERAIEIQEALGSDIATSFDQLVDPTLPTAEVGAAMDRTHRWAERCLAARTRADQALF